MSCSLTCFSSLSRTLQAIPDDDTHFAVGSRLLGLDAAGLRKWLTHRKVVRSIFLPCLTLFKKQDTFKALVLHPTPISNQTKPRNVLAISGPLGNIGHLCSQNERLHVISHDTSGFTLQIQTGREVFTKPVTVEAATFSLHALVCVTRSEPFLVCWSLL